MDHRLEIRTRPMRVAVLAILMIACLPAVQMHADSPLPAAAVSASPTASDFSERADRALESMQARADALGVSGVAVVAYAEGDPVASWSSKMRVVGKMTEPASGDRRGSNLLAIAYTKASEMADTLQDSGSGIRPTMTGETGWHGGLIRKVPTGYLIAAFSGASSEDDIKISRAGLDILEAGSEDP